MWSQTTLSGLLSRFWKLTPNTKTTTMFQFIIKYVTIGLALSAVILIGLSLMQRDGELNGYTPENSTMPFSYANAINAARPAVVRIFVQRGRSLRNSGIGQGSGIIFNEDGYIITSLHVVQSARLIEVELLDGRRQQAKFIGRDPVTDLAVLKISLPDINAIPIDLELENRVGDVVFAIGYPAPAVQTTTMGIISATGRYFEFGQNVSDFIQTDAAINPGSSGGALVNSQGNLIGLIAAFSRDDQIDGIGYAIPLERIYFVFNELVTNGRVSRGWLGLGTNNRPSGLCASLYEPGKMYQFIYAVEKGSPADIAGIKPRDVLAEINGQSFEEFSDLYRAVNELKPDTDAKLKLLRPIDNRCEMIEVTARITDYPS